MVRLFFVGRIWKISKATLLQIIETSLKLEIMKKANLLIFLLLPLFCIAQSTLKLKGKITNEIASLEWADVSISNLEGKIIDGTTTKQDGTFEINLKKGIYKITISLLGFSEYEKEISIEKDTDLGIIILKETAANLGEVVIKTKKKMVNKKGMYLANFFLPIFGIATSSLTNNTIGSMKDCTPLGAVVMPVFL